MKLTNLSLAVLVAIGVAACGGSDDNNSNKPADNGNKNQNQNQNQNQNNNQNNQAADQNIVDPTGTKVVDNKDLSKEQTVGTLQYVRRDGSRYDREVNPSKPASASPLLGVDLGQQNPSLTNIVLARQQVTRPDGVPVRAQFAGMDNPVPLKNDGTANHDSKTDGNGLQEENFRNVDLFAGMYSRVGQKDKHTVNNTDDKGKFNRAANTTTPQVASSVNGTAGDSFEKVKYAPAADNLSADPTSYNGTLAQDKLINAGPRGYKARNATSGAVDAIAATDGVKAAKTLTAIIDRTYYQKKTNAAGTATAAISLTDKKYQDKEGKDIYYYRGETPAVAGSVAKVTTTLEKAAAKGARYGKDLVWWSAPETAFENEFTRTGKDTLDATKIGANELPNTFGTSAPDTKNAYENGDAATNGLVRIGNGMNTLGQELNYNKETGKWEDHHNTTTRIFGRYHLAYANLDKKTVNPVGLNSYTGAKSFIAEYESDNSGKVGKATQYSLGAVPNTLNYVQYGRVSTNLDLDAGEGGYSDHFMRNPYLHKNDEQGVDNYFYRGTNATTIAQMEALPSNQTAVYNGHALMYGIDNDFHGGANRNLPNAFAGGSNGLGLGNFVQANVNFGQKRVTGNVYNEWLTDPAKNVTVKDNLVRFQGKIEGNTVVGTADRTYIGGDDNATFKASFFGEKAEEMGGSFNSVTDTDKYGPAYGTNDWGGVFGATKGGSGNTFQGDDSANKYGGL